MASRWQLGLPLLTKELLEQSARRRTYVIRVLFVGFLFYLAMTTMAAQLQGTTALTALGQGTTILQSLISFEFNGIYLFLPAMACGVFTVEKERNTLPLLFLTRLGPWTIIVEKLLSRMLPMLMFLFCALPVMAFTYSMGGLTILQLFAAAYFLVLSLFQIACVAVMCSAYAHSTTAAFVQTYVAILLLTHLPQFLSMFIPSALLSYAIESLVHVCDFLAGIESPQGPYAAYRYGIGPYTLYNMFSPPALFQNMLNTSFGTTMPPPTLLVALGIPTFVSGILCLGVARWALYRRAAVQASNPLLKFFRWIDVIFFWLHSRVKFDVKLVREAGSLPDYEPIAWREVSKRSLGQFRYLVRIMVPLLFPVIFVGMFVATSSVNDWNTAGPNLGLTPLVLFLGMVDLVLIAVVAANVIPLERTRQTWDVLRSMPLSGEAMLKQKLRGVRRLQWVCSIPVLAAIGLNAWWRYQLLTAGLSNSVPGSQFPGSNFLWWEYLIGAVGSLILCSELVKWICLWGGLVFRTSMRAILLSLACVGAFAILPSLILQMVIGLGFHLFQPELDLATVSEGGRLLLVSPRLISPIHFIAINETSDVRLRILSSIPVVPAAIHLAWQGLLLFVLRRHILGRAEWYLGRIGVPPQRRSRRDPATDSAEHNAKTLAEELAPVAGAAS